MLNVSTTSPHYKKKKKKKIKICKFNLFDDKWAIMAKTCENLYQCRRQWAFLFNTFFTNAFLLNPWNKQTNKQKSLFIGIIGWKGKHVDDYSWNFIDLILGVYLLCYQPILVVTTIVPSTCIVLKDSIAVDKDYMNDEDSKKEK